MKVYATAYSILEEIGIDINSDNPNTRKSG